MYFNKDIAQNKDRFIELPDMKDIQIDVVLILQLWSVCFSRIEIYSPGYTQKQILFIFG